MQVLHIGLDASASTAAAAGVLSRMPALRTVSIACDCSDDAMLTMCHALASLPQLTGVRLRGAVSTAAGAVLRALPPLRSLRVHCLRGVAGDETDAVSEALGAQAALTSLDISSSNLATLSRSHLASAFGGGLRHLRASGCGLQGAGAAAVAAARCPALESLDLSDNPLADIGSCARAFHGHQCLTALDLTHTESSVGAVTAAAPAFAALTALRRLRISATDAPVQSMRRRRPEVHAACFLAPHLSALVNLTELDLSATPEAAFGAEMLAAVRCLPALTALVTLNLARATVPVPPLAAALRTAHFKPLQSVSLVGVPLGGAAAGIAACLPLSLTHLNLMECAVGLPAVDAEALGRAVANLPALQKLWLGGNRLDAAAVAALAPHLRHLSALCLLDLSSSAVTGAAAAALGAALAGMSALKQLLLWNTTRTLDDVQEICCGGCAGAQVALPALESLCMGGQNFQFEVGAERRWPEAVPPALLSSLERRQGACAAQHVAVDC